MWSSRTLSAALVTQGLHLQPRTMRKYLRLMGARYQRTKSCLPPTYAWNRPGCRPHVPYGNTQGRRVNVLAALAAPAPPPRRPGGAARTWKSADVRDFLLYRLPTGRGQPRVVELDNDSCHRSQKMQQALSPLRDEGIELYFLPPYSPKLNDIEPYFGRVKHQEMPIRSYTSTPKLIQTIHAAFRRIEKDLITRQTSMPIA